jgi:hypothetical protein
MNVIDYILVEKLKVNSKTKIDTNDKITYKIPTGKIAEKMFNACMESENNQDIYKQNFEPLVNKLLKIQPNSLQLSTIENSKELVNLVVKCAAKGRCNNIGSKNLQLLRKYILANVLKSKTGYDYYLTQEQEDYMIEWDFYNGPNKLEWT